MEGLNTLQRILNSLATTLDGGGPQLSTVLMGYVALFAMFALIAMCYGLLWNGRVLPSAIGLLLRLALVTMAMAKPDA